MLAVTGFLAFKVYEHINGLEDSDTVNKESLPPQKPASFSPEVLEEKADKAFEEGDIEAAKKLLEEAYAKEKNSIDILNKLGFIASQEEDYKTAIEYANLALEIDSEDSSVYGALASFYRHEKAFEKSQEHFEKAIVLDDSNEFTHFNYANLLLDMNDKKRAKVHYQKALLLKPDFIQAQFELDKLS
jgi:tetratricopeptide (TPR) repeat protein